MPIAAKIKLTGWAKNIWQNFRLTVEMWFQIFEYQHRVCCVCGRASPDRRLSTDHEHKSGLIRGLLCQRCNRVFGKIENPRWEMTPALLRKLADYWEHPTAVLALGREIYGLKGRTGTAVRRKMIKKLEKQGLLKSSRIMHQ